MFSTKSAQALRNLFAGYHEPPSLSTQQTQKLVDGLKKSFRQQLDLEYGAHSERPAASATMGEKGCRIRHSAATLHLKSILSNPLFSYNKQHVPLATSGLPSAKSDPMDVFDRAVSKGMMTLKAATGCIMAKRQILSCHENRSGLASSQTALRVVRWLNSTGAEAHLSFLDDKPFIRALTPLLVAEGLEDTAWNWVSRTVTDTDASWDSALRIKRASFLLTEMARTKRQPQYGNLDAAITTILHAEQLYHNHPLLPEILVYPWRCLSWLSTVNSYRHVARSGAIFDAHIAMADLLPQTVEVETAHLHLHHPTCPDDMPAMRFFNDKEKLRSLVRTLSSETHEKRSRPIGIHTLPWLRFLGHDTVTHLWRMGRKEEADFVEKRLCAALSAFRHLSWNATWT
ncbi:hypothetical protein E4U55_004402 [Claviceps digitariae]|nr:hypothetical protein E4U55_004402 [Claviceps digitariae]